MYHLTKVCIYAKKANRNNKNTCFICVCAFFLVPLQSIKMRIYAKKANRDDNSTSHLSQTTH